MTEAVLPSKPRTNSIVRWLKAVRAYSFTASMVPVVTGALLALGEPSTRWELLPFIILGALFLHIGTNLVNDFYDYDLGVDHEGALGGSGVLVSGELTAKQIGRGAVISFGIAALLGVPLIVARGLPIIGLGVVGILGGALYTAKPVQYKYWGAGDALVFLLMGPLMVGGAHFALTGMWESGPWLVSIPIGLLVTAILHANNLRDLELDAEFELKTFAIRLGRKRSVRYLQALIGTAYLALVVLAALKILPYPALLALFSAPLGMALGKAAARQKPGEVEPDIVGQAAGLHLLFGVLLALGLVAAHFLVVG